MKKSYKDRLIEIMHIARKLSWFYDNPNGYPLMQGSEVEKCILMAMDDAELQTYREAADNPFTVALNAHDNPRGGQVTEESEERFKLLHKNLNLFFKEKIETNQ